jgi:hypothetical protein
MGAVIGRWNTEILPHWDAMRTTRRVKDMVFDGVPPPVREAVWARAVGNDLNITAEYYAILRRQAQEKAAMDGPDGTAALIPLDLARTFPMLDFFKAGGPYHGRLQHVLEAYTCYRPDIGYVQGMSYLAAMFLLNVTHDHDAFVCFANLLHRPILLAFYRMDESTVCTRMLMPPLPRCIVLYCTARHGTG